MRVRRSERCHQSYDPSRKRSKNKKSSEVSAGVSSEYCWEKKPHNTRKETETLSSHYSRFEGVFQKDAVKYFILLGIPAILTSIWLYFGFRPHPVDATIEWMDWERIIQISEVKRLHENIWLEKLSDYDGDFYDKQVVGSQHYVDTGSSMNHNTSYCKIKTETIHYTVSERCNPRTVTTPWQRHCTSSTTSSGALKQSCSTSSPTTRTEWSSCPVQKTRREDHELCLQVPIEYNDWVYTRDTKTYGNPNINPAPYWWNPELTDNHDTRYTLWEEKESGRSEKYQLHMSYDSKTDTVPVPLSEYSKLTIWDKCKAQASYFRGLIDGTISCHE